MIMSGPRFSGIALQALTIHDGSRGAVLSLSTQSKIMSGPGSLPLTLPALTITSRAL